MDSRLYDLTLDTGRLGLARSIELIDAAARHVSSAAATAGRA